MFRHFRSPICAFRFPLSRPATALLCVVSAIGIGLNSPSVAQAAAADDWWHPAWSHRKRVRVCLAPSEPLGFRCRPPAAGAEDTVAAEARIPCEAKLQAPAQQVIRVVDSGGNVLPCVAEEPDAHGLVRVTFPARRTIAGKLADAIQNGTKAVTLDVGRDKAVAPGTRFYALAGANRIATLQVESVQAKSSAARVLDKATPNIAAGIPVESDVVTSADYFIYYGNPKPEGEAPRWAPPAPTISLFGWRITDGQFLSQLEEARPSYRLMPADGLKAALRSSPAFVGSQALRVIDSPGNPLGYDSDWHVSLYESFFRCDLPGLYRFSVDSSAPAYLFVNGKLAAQRASFFYQVAGNFEHRGKVELGEGYHHLVVAAVETAKACNTRLGWQPINATTFTSVPASFYLNRVGADTVGFDTRAERQQVCFAYKLAPLSVAADKGRRFQFVRFQGLMPAPPDDDTTAYRWDFGDGAQGAGVAPGHLYEVPAADTAASFPVTLQAVRDGKPVGQYKQTVLCDPRPAEKLNLSLDIVSFANIVYFDERTSVAVRIRNAGFSPVVVRAVGRLESSDDRQIIINQDIPIEGKDENFCVLPVDMKQLHDKAALIELEVRLGGQLVLDAAARAIPFGELTRRGKVALEDGQLVLGPGGPYSGAAWTREFPTINYEVTLHVQRRAGRSLCNVTFPVGSALCTLRPRAWDLTFERDRWYELRLRVTEARVEAWLDGRKLADVPRAAAQTALPLAFDALKPFGVHAALGTQVAIRHIAVGRLDGAPAAPPPGPQPKPPAEPAPTAKRRPRGAPEPAPVKPPAEPPAANPPDAPKPAAWTTLFDGSLDGWKTAAECDLALLQRGLGSLHDYDGRRVMISTEMEDADRHLQYVFSRYIHERFIASRSSVLIFGDRMANPAPPGKTFPDYVAALEDRLKKANRPFQFVERTSGLLPTIADVALFARTLQALDQFPDIIVISPGLADVQQAVGDRDFPRSFDLMIDAVRATGKSIKLILVSPPPCPRNVRVSRLYTQAVEKLARDHHAKFLNLDTLFTQNQDDWLKTLYAAPDAEGIFLDNPNEAAHSAIADAIEKLLKR